jgi:hypothetical protein
MELSQPPIGIIRWLLDNNSLVPFLGAGASTQISANPEDEKLRSAVGLAEALGEFCFPGLNTTVHSLMEIAAVTELVHDRFSLEKEVYRLISDAGEPQRIHKWLARSSASLIVTTNYDSLLERAFHEAGREFEMLMTLVEGDIEKVFWWPAGAMEPRLVMPGDYRIFETKTPLIYKIHGGLDPARSWRRCVITEDDYFQFGCRLYGGSILPKQVAAVLHNTPMLFLGYSLRDVHVRNFVSRLARASSAESSFLLSKRLLELDRVRFLKMGIHAYEITIEEFLALLTQAPPNSR